MLSTTIYKRLWRPSTLLLPWQACVCKSKLRVPRSISGRPKGQCTPPPPARHNPNGGGVLACVPKISDPVTCVHPSSCKDIGAISVAEKIRRAEVRKEQLDNKNPRIIPTVTFTQHSLLIFYLAYRLTFFRSIVRHSFWHIF